MKKVTPDILHFIDQWLSYKWKYDKLTGLSVGFSLDKKIVFHKSYGYKNLEKKQKTRLDTAYRVASVSKVFTAIAILQLAQTGKLKLSDKVTKYLPEFASKTDKKQNNLTIQQLLTHTSLITRDGNYGQWNSGKFPKREILFQQAQAGILFKSPEVRWKYSNYGYSLLGLIIEKASGLTYENFINKHIVKPLGMANTVSDLNPRLNKQLATGYVSALPGIKQHPVKHFQTYDMAGATGITTTIEDLLKFGIAIVSQSPKILNKNYWKQAFKKQWSHEKMWRNLIMMAKEKDKSNIYLHGGSFPGFSTRFLIDPKNKLSIAVMINTNLSPDFTYSNGVHNILCAADKTLAKLAKLKTKPKTPSQYTGIYLGRNWPLGISVINGQLVAYDPTDSNPLKTATWFEYISDHTFRIHDTDGYGFNGEMARFITKHDKVIGLDLGGYYLKLSNL